ncbi:MULTISPECIES: restriction endonuclease subunit S [unclassified Polynucleobacter]|uniref:restriction endonuclease subunit S n=1 Tax=unclassified Polynucleobacter TaxID=2640945 RepID=UPI000BCD9336|nr:MULTISPECIES: restriction endonuclease subunit S [unclassified Polynucleobacter]OYY20925.1 MAG: hypothetical protein B7Y67_03870 [Polynucleobacter sp. 35-46-11]OZA77867.1 MAG: hypothetical protein B7X71_03470 [Polynucleobacter sp. 39-46-10]
MNWKTVPLGDLCEVLDSKRKPISKRNRTEGIYPYYGATGIVDYLNDYIFDDKLVLIGEDGAKWGSGDMTAFIAQGKYWVNNHAHVLKPFENVLLDEWLVYYFYYKDLKEYVSGLTVPKLNQGQLKLIPIPLPSILTQKKIVEKINAIFIEIDKAITATQANIKNSEALFDSGLELFLNAQRDGWIENIKPLSELCELIVDCEHKTAPTQSDGFPSIRTPNIGKGKLLLDNVYRVSEETYTEWTKRAQPRAGDLILAREAPAGNVAVIPENIKVCLGQRTVLIRPRPDIFMPNFLAFMLLQPNIQAKLLAHSRGATVQHVNMKDIRALNIGSIPPLLVQRKIISYIQTIDNEAEILQASYKQKLIALSKLKNSILRQAFNGELVKD